jgi:hypothetical protein
LRGMIEPRNATGRVPVAAVASVRQEPDLWRTNTFGLRTVVAVVVVRRWEKRTDTLAPRCPSTCSLAR